MQRRRVPRQLGPGRPIRNQRTRLDRDRIKPEPPDPDPTALILRYRFSLPFLLKSPWTFRELTRDPLQFKNNSRSALFLAFRPLSFPDFEPAIQSLSFLTLDPRSNL